MAAPTPTRLKTCTASILTADDFALVVALAAPDDVDDGRTVVS